MTRCGDSWLQASEQVYRDKGGVVGEGQRGCGCHPREGVTPPSDTLWSYQVTVAAVRGRQRQNAVHLFATRFIITNIRVVITGER